MKTGGFPLALVFQDSLCAHLLCEQGWGLRPHGGVVPGQEAQVGWMTSPRLGEGVQDPRPWTPHLVGASSVPTEGKQGN